MSKQGKPDQLLAFSKKARKDTAASKANQPLAQKKVIHKKEK
jgi:hypothetical protein